MSKLMSCLLVLTLSLVLLAEPLGATQFTVTHGGNSGAGSLRTAIEQVNADASATPANPHLIIFNGVSTVTLSTALPALTRATLVNPFGNPVTIRATSLVTGNGFRLSGEAAASAYLQNLRIVCTNPIPCFSGAGIRVESSNNTLSESTLDLVTVDNVGGNGIEISDSRVHIDRSVVVRAGRSGGTDGHGLRCSGGTDSLIGRIRVTRSRFGVDAAGLAAGNARDGLNLTRCSLSEIGTGPGHGNVISANGRDGIYMDRSHSVDIYSNIIGLDPQGTSARGNAGDGVYALNSDSTDVGGLEEGLGNVISANTNANVRLTRTSTFARATSRVRGNIIGPRSDGFPLPPGVPPSDVGVSVSGSQWIRVGQGDFGNLIAFNVRGVEMQSTNVLNTQIRGKLTLSRNSIHSNDLGIFGSEVGLNPVITQLLGNSLIAGHVPEGAIGGVLEFFVDDWEQGKLYVGETTVEGMGAQGAEFATVINLAVHQGKRLTAIYRSPSNVPDDFEGTEGFSVPVPIGNVLTVNLSGAGNGERVSSNPLNIDCPGFCSAGYSGGTATLTATPNANRQVNWSGACNGSGTCVVSMNQNRVVNASFGPVQRTLTVVRNGQGAVSSNPAGIQCGEQCSAEYNHGTTVTLVAQPAANWVFAGWSGACAGLSTCQVSMTAARSVTATFTPITHSLSVSRTGQGSVSSNPAGISCGSTCSAAFAQGSSVELTASPAQGWQFSHWTGAGTGTGTVRTLNISQALSVGAVFTQIPAPQFTLTVQRTGSGSVSSNPAGINCGGSCSANFDEGTIVSLSATPGDGWQFSGWGGNCHGAAACFVTMDQARSVSATFVQNPPPQFAVTVNRTGQGTVTSDPAGINCGAVCSALFDQGTVVTLNATPAEGWQFSGWTGTCTGTAACVLNMTQARSVNAMFTLLPVDQFLLTVSKTGQGTVSSTPAGIDCGASCSASFQSGTVVDLIATPANGQVFHAWSGACNGAAACSVTMSEARSVHALFLAAGDPVFRNNFD